MTPMHNHVLHAVLNDEDLAVLRASASTMQAIQLAPEKYSAREIEQAILRDMQLTANLWKEYNVPIEATAVAISATSGAIMIHQS